MRFLTIFLIVVAGACAWAEDELEVERVLVTGGVPPGAEVGIQGQVLTNDIHGGNSQTFADWLVRHGTGVTVSYPQGNTYQPELSYRGYSASGLLGLPQGLAVYQNGTRVNEAFGDVVNFDSVPELAIDHVSIVSGANPLFGLNALGGAIAVRMKDGFSHPDSEFGASAGSFGKLSSQYQISASSERFAGYFAGSYSSESGWRDFSPSRSFQSYLDVRGRGEDPEGNLGTVGVSGTFSESDLNGNGAAPVELLAADRAAVFTHPDNALNDTRMFQLYSTAESAKGGHKLSLRLSYRRTRQENFGGDESDAYNCPENLGFSGRFICIADEEEGSSNPEDDPRAVDINGEPVLAVGDGPYGAINRSLTWSDTNAIHIEYARRTPAILSEITAGLGGNDSVSNFNSTTELGKLTANRSVEGSDFFLAGDEFNTALTARNRYLYAFAGTAITAGNLTTALAGQFNFSEITLEDGRGTALDGTHQFTSINGTIHSRLKLSDSASVFVSAAQNSRTPSPAELSCADPMRPCRFPNAFIADPALDQVVAQSLEGGARGSFNFEVGGGSSELDVSVTAFNVTNQDDIIFVSAGALIGSGYFRNAGQTLRRGLEASVQFESGPLRIEAGYAYIEASFQDALTIMAVDNPNANDDGEISVNPGDRIPLIPLHSSHASLAWSITSAVTARVGMNSVSERFYRGDEGNDGDPLPAFQTVHARLDARLGKNWNAYVSVTNALNAEYSTFGIFGQADEIAFPELTTQPADPRFTTPAAPFAIAAGISLKTGRFLRR